MAGAGVKVLVVVMVGVAFLVVVVVVVCDRPLDCASHRSSRPTGVMSTASKRLGASVSPPTLAYDLDRRMRS